MPQKLEKSFFSRNALIVAPELLGKFICRRFPNNEIHAYRIIEVEAYCGEEDLACHASKGKTNRTKVMYAEGGFIYMYLIYGMYWMLNIVTGLEEQPQAVLILGVEGTVGPGRVGKLLELDKTFYGEKIWDSNRIWVESAPVMHNVKTGPRININYAGEPWINKSWRFYM